MLRSKKPMVRETEPLLVSAMEGFVGFLSATELETVFVPLNIFSYSKNCSKLGQISHQSAQNLFSNLLNYKHKPNLINSKIIEVI